MSAPHEDDRAPTPAGGEHDFGADAGGPDVDPLAAELRQRLQQAVSALEPRPGTLEYLRRAVPARRRRRHAAMAATAVTVFAVGVGATFAARGSLLPASQSQTGGSNVGNLMTTGTNNAPGGGSGHGPGPVGGHDTDQPPGSAGATSGSAGTTAPTTRAQASVSGAPATSVDGSPLAPACQSSSVLSVVGTQGAPADGVTYETVIGTVKTACTLTGRPPLTVLDAAGRAAKVPQYGPDWAAAPRLPDLPGGQVLLLLPGDQFEFQYAWVGLPCTTNRPPTSGTSGPTSAPTSGTPTELPTTPASSVSGPTVPTPTEPTPTGSQSSSPATSAFSVSYVLSGTKPAQSASFAAACGAALYVTDYFTPDGQRVRHVGDVPSTAPATSATSATSAGPH